MYTTYVNRMKGQHDAADVVDYVISDVIGRMNAFTYDSGSLDSLWDAYERLLDAAVFLRREIMIRELAIHGNTDRS